MAIADDDIEKIRSAVSIVDVIGEHVQLRKQGRNWMGLCPFHAERTPSFSVREEMGRYRCFGCDQSGDVFSFVQETQHVDFVTAVEQLASRAGIALTYTSSGQSKQRARRKRLTEAMGTAVGWYHDRLLGSNDARTARGYLRSRQIDGELARQFQLGWAPDDWDALSRNSGIDHELLRENGLAFKNRAGRMQDFFRGRVLFPIYTENGEPVAMGGRILPGADDPAKYKNSTETPIYTKSRTLYALNWAKADIVNASEAIVCEGYTDVIGFFRAGLPRAVATCGTAFTEEHVRLLKRYTNRVVLAFDADAAGQGAAERFYEWEEKYQVEVHVAEFPGGKDPGELSESDPEALAKAIADAKPFLRFRLDRVLGSRPADTPEHKVRLGSASMAVVNEHPNRDVRKLYAGEVATTIGLPVADLVRMAERRERRPRMEAPAPARPRRRDNAEFVILALVAQDFDSVADFVVPALFHDEVLRRAFEAILLAGGDIHAALNAADPDAREVLDRAAVVDVEVDPETEACNLIGMAVRRELRRPPSAEAAIEDLQSDRDAKVRADALARSPRDLADVEWLLVWLQERIESREQ